MLQGWQIRLREAEKACQQGRLERASELVGDEALDTFSPGDQVRQKIAEAWAQRAQDKLSAGELDSACHDLKQAEALVGENDSTLNVRRQANQLVTKEVCDLLARGSTSEALDRLAASDARQLDSHAIESLEQAAEKLSVARELRLKAKFAESLRELVAAQTIRPDLRFISEQEEATHELMGRYAILEESLHEKIRAGDWPAAVQLAERMLVMAPQSELAREARKKGWEVVKAKNELDARPDSDSEPVRTPAAAPKASDDTANLGNRFLLWVDAVGGYLVCQDPVVEIGQASPSNQVHVPIIADLSRHHARLRREGESYMLEPQSEVIVNGVPRTEPWLLSDNDLLEFGAVRLRFRQPHALSATARLDMESRHRTQPSADGVLLFAESCVLGPGAGNHIVCRDWDTDVVLFRKDDKLMCRSMKPVEVDGNVCESRAELTLNSRICGEDFSMSLEPLQ